MVLDRTAVTGSSVIIFDGIKAIIIEKGTPLFLQMFGLEHLLLPLVCFCLINNKLRTFYQTHGVLRWRPLNHRVRQCYTLREGLLSRPWSGSSGEMFYDSFHRVSSFSRYSSSLSNSTLSASEFTLFLSGARPQKRFQEIASTDSASLEFRVTFFSICRLKLVSYHQVCLCIFNTSYLSSGIVT